MMKNSSLEGDVWALSATSGIPIDADWHAIAAAGVNPGALLEGDYNGMSVLEILDSLLQRGGGNKLEYIIAAQRIIIHPRGASADGVHLSADVTSVK